MTEREIAEAAIGEYERSHIGSCGGPDVQCDMLCVDNARLAEAKRQFSKYFTPQRVLALLEEVERLRRAAERGREEIQYQISHVRDVDFQARAHSALQLIDYYIASPDGGGR